MTEAAPETAAETTAEAPPEETPDAATEESTEVVEDAPEKPRTADHDDPDRGWTVQQAPQG